MASSITNASRADCAVLASDGAQRTAGVASHCALIRLAATLSRRQTPHGRAEATVEAFARPGRQTRRSRACAYPVPGSVGAGCVWRRFKVLPLLPNSYTQERWPTLRGPPIPALGRCSKGPGLKCSLRRQAEASPRPRGRRRHAALRGANIQPQPVSLRPACCRGRGTSTLCGEGGCIWRNTFNATVCGIAAEDGGCTARYVGRPPARHSGALQF